MTRTGKTRQLAPETLVGDSLSLVMALALGPDAILKAVAHPAVVESMAAIGLSKPALQLLGVVEVLCLIAFLTPITRFAGMLVLTGYLAGAALAGVIHPAELLIVLGFHLAVWIGVWFRLPGTPAMLRLLKSEASVRETDRAADAQPTVGFPAAFEA